MEQTGPQSALSGLDEVIRAYKSGIDRTLLRENLKLSVEQRLVNLIKLHEFAEAIRGAGRPARNRP
jgi:hypothetical protein